MAWKCKECGGKIYAIVTSSQSKTFILGKSGTPERCLRKHTEETIGINYFCNKCEKYYNTGTKLEDIADWEEVIICGNVDGVEQKYLKEEL